MKCEELVVYECYLDLDDIDILVFLCNCRRW